MMPYLQVEGRYFFFRRRCNDRTEGPLDLKHIEVGLFDTKLCCRIDVQDLNSMIEYFKKYILE